MRHKAAWRPQAAQGCMDVLSCSIKNIMNYFIKNIMKFVIVMWCDYCTGSSRGSTRPLPWTQLSGKHAPTPLDAALGEALAPSLGRRPRGGHFCTLCRDETASQPKVSLLLLIVTGTLVTCARAAPGSLRGRPMKSHTNALSYAHAHGCT